jgi:hypothetical protein
MTIRTVKIQGLAYGSVPAEITVTANGNTVFSGAVSTLDQPLPTLPDPSLSASTVTLCTFEIDQTFVGQIPMTCEVTQGTVIFAQILANYSTILNPVYTPEQLTVIGDPAVPTTQEQVAILTTLANPPLSQVDIDMLLDPNLRVEDYDVILAAHNLTLSSSSGADGYAKIDNTDPRSNVQINGVVQAPDHTDLPGAWWWPISSGSTLAYNLDVDPAAP